MFGNFKAPLGLAGSHRDGRWHRRLTGSNHQHAGLSLQPLGVSRTKRNGS